MTGSNSWKSWLQLLLGIMSVVILGLGLVRARQVVDQKTLPDGWQIIRPPHEVSALIVDDDTIWAGGQDGLYLIDRTSGELLTPPPGTPDVRRVRGLLLDANGALWIAHRDGVSVRTQGTWQTLGQDEGLLSGAATALYQDRQGTIWIGQERGLAALRKGEIETYTATEGLNLPGVDVIYQDDGGNLWFGCSHATRGGLTRYTEGEWQPISDQIALIHPSVNAIIQDTDGVLWMGTGFADRGGAMRYKDGEWAVWTEAQGLAGAKVRSVFQDRDERLWFGSEYEGLAITNGQGWMILDVRDGLADAEVKVICQDDRGIYWLGTANGINRIERLNWQPTQGEDKP